MIVRNRHPRRTAGVGVALVVGGLLACSHSYRPVPAATLDAGSQREYGKLLVVTRDGYELELAHAFIRPDSVVGFTTDKDKRRLAIAHDQVVRIETYEWGKRETARNTPPPSAEDGAEAVRDVACVLSLFTLCPPPPKPPPQKGPKGTPTAH